MSKKKIDTSNDEKIKKENKNMQEKECTELYLASSTIKEWQA